MYRPSFHNRYSEKSNAAGALSAPKAASFSVLHEGSSTMPTSKSPPHCIGE